MEAVEENLPIEDRFRVCANIGLPGTIIGYLRAGTTGSLRKEEQLRLLRDALVTEAEGFREGDSGRSVGMTKILALDTFTSDPDNDDIDALLDQLEGIGEHREAW